MPKSLPDALDLPAPVLVEAEGNKEVDSLKLLDGGTVRVCYEDMRPSDRITLHWPIVNDVYPPLEPQNGVDGGCIDIYIAPHYIALWLDTYALFTYTVTRDGEDQTSPEGQVRISLPKLPQVQILDAIDNKLDLSLLCCKDPVLYIPPWVFAFPIQTINCYLSGTYIDGSKARLYPFKHEPVTEEDVRDGWRRPLPRDELLKLIHDSELYIVCEVRFNPTGGVYRLFPSLLPTLLTEPHLELSPPELREAVHTEFDGWVVNPINTEKGAHIVVAYEGMCSGDRVCPTLAGTPGPGSPSLECRQPAEGETSLVFAAPPSAISANFNQVITLTYNVTRCDESRWSSPERRVKVLGLTGLPRPSIEEATGNRLDLNTFSADATGVMPVWPYAEVGQFCWMWISGVLENGHDFEFHVLEGEPLTPEWRRDGVSTPILRTKLQQLADCSKFELHFAVNFNNECDRDSAQKFPIRFFSIEQEALVLPAPTVCEAVDDHLTIWNGRDGVTLRAQYEGISARHLIKADWLPLGGTSLPLESQPGNSDPGYADIKVSREAVIEGAGKTILVSYTVSNACKLAPSKTRALKISLPTRLPTPVVREATTPPAPQGGILDLRTFGGDAHITVNDGNFDTAWWFILEGQIASMTCTGVAEDGSSLTITIMHKEPIKTGDLNELSRVIPRADLEKFKDKTDLEFKFKCTMDKNLESAALDFQPLTLKFRKRYRQMANFNSRTLEGWEVGTGAPDARDISFEPQSDGFAVKNYTYSNRNVGPILQKRFTDLEAGHEYRFSVKVRRFNTANPTPKLSLRLDASQKTPVLELVDTSWQSLSFTFVASTTRVLLDIYSHEMDTGVSGNDYLMEDFLVEEV